MILRTHDIYFDVLLYFYPFTLQCRKMVIHTLKMLQDFENVSDHFSTLRSKGLRTFQTSLLAAL